MFVTLHLEGILDDETDELVDALGDLILRHHRENGGVTLEYRSENWKPVSEKIDAFLEG